MEEESFPWRLVRNENLTLADIPGPNADWAEISDFALGYYCHTADGSNGDRVFRYERPPSDSLDDMRAWLFEQQRGIRHVGEEPEEEELKALREVIGRIRAWIASAR